MIQTLAQDDDDRPEISNSVDIMSGERTYHEGGFPLRWFQFSIPILEGFHHDYRVSCAELEDSGFLTDYIFIFYADHLCFMRTRR